jgi:hypothetical protein
MSDSMVEKVKAAIAEVVCNDGVWRWRGMATSDDELGREWQAQAAIAVLRDPTDVMLNQFDWVSGTDAREKNREAWRLAIGAALNEFDATPH